MTDLQRAKAIKKLGAAVVRSPAKLRRLVTEVKNVKFDRSPRCPATLPRKGMRFARMVVPIFANTDRKHVEFSRQALTAGVIGLALQNFAWLRAHPDTPPLYESGVIYKPEKHRVNCKGEVIEYGEDWQTIPWVIYNGRGDCEDLGAWLVAEYWKKGIRALPHIAIKRLADDGGKAVWRAHVQVRLPDGRIEDPSAKLGMYAYAGLY